MDEEQEQHEEKIIDFNSRYKTITTREKIAMFLECAESIPEINVMFKNSKYSIKDVYLDKMVEEIEAKNSPSKDGRKR